MKKKIFIIVGIIVFIVAVIAGVLYFSKDESGKELELTYTVYGGTPYEWKVSIEDESIVKLDRSYNLEDKNNEGLDGAPVSTNYVFKGLKKGDTYVTFQYVNFVTGDVEKEEVHHIRVDKNKNISLQLDLDKK